MAKHFLLKVAQLLNIARVERPTMYQYSSGPCGGS